MCNCLKASGDAADSLDLHNAVCAICKLLGCGSGTPGAVALGLPSFGSGRNPQNIACLICSALGCNGNASRPPKAMAYAPPANGVNANNIACAICALLGCGGSPSVLGGMLGGVTTIDLAHVHSRMDSTIKALGLPGAPAVPGVITKLHLTPAGDQLISSTSIDFPTNKIRIPLHGTILGIVYDLEMDLTLDLLAGTITVELKVNQPFALDQKWIFKIDGLIPFPGQGMTGAAASGVHLESSQLVPSAPAPSSPKIDILCILGCGGAQLLPILSQCVLSLIGGTPAFLACLAAQAPGAVATIANCIATQCAKQ